MSDTVFVPMGNGCAPAGALREMNLRKTALPFDWITGDINTMITCLRNDFEGFHCGVNLGYGRSENTVLIDSLGFKFHHDYPTTDEPTPVFEESGTYLGGRTEHRIVDNWSEFYPDVYAKYLRRIERFRSILRGEARVVLCCRLGVADSLAIQHVLHELYGKIFTIVTATKEDSSIPTIHTCDTERNGKWNDTDVWLETFTKTGILCTTD